MAYASDVGKTSNTMKYIDIIKRLTFVKSMSSYVKLHNWRHFIREFNNFRKLTVNKSKRFSLEWRDLYPCFGDNTASTNFDRHYVYHTAWAARILAVTKPEFHVDISSSLHFSTIVSAFIPVKFYDYRPVDLKLSQLTTEHADLVSLPFDDFSIQSISCMHVVEHVGLGRYGDPLDPDGDLKAIGELQRVLAAGGSLLFAVPIGRPKIMFNAHRIYAYEQILRYFREMQLKEFALIPDGPDSSGIIYDASQELANAQDYGCGCFWFTK